MSLPKKATVLEGNAVTFMARIADENGQYLQQSNISAIGYKIYDVTESSRSAIRAVSSGSLVVASVVFNSLQTGGAWTLDSTGYNFKWTLAAGTTIDDAVFTEQNFSKPRIYGINFKFTASDATRNFYIPFELTVQNNLYERP